MYTVSVVVLKQIKILIEQGLFIRMTKPRHNMQIFRFAFYDFEGTLFKLITQRLIGICKLYQINQNI